MRVLRDYQELAHKQIIEAFKQYKRPLLVMPTGAGKSYTTTSFIKKFTYYKFILMVRTRNLVFQLEQDLKKSEIDYAIFMAGEKKDFSKRIQLVSKDTLEARKEYPFIGEDNVVFITDEADEYKDFQKHVIEKYSSESKRFFYMGETATPYNQLDHFDVALTPITAKELNKRGILVDYDYVVPKDAITYEDVTITKGEWSTKQVAMKFDTPTMIKICFENWLTHGDSRQTLVFCANKKHAENFRDYINNYFQKEMAVFIFDKTPEDVRDKAFKDFSEGRIRFLLNIRIITRGVDLPVIGCILDMGSTLNVNLHIQKLGRGSRQNPFYKNCIVIDMARNCLVPALNHFYFEREISLTSSYKPKKTDLEVLAMRVCIKCFRAGMREDYGPKNTCPFCGTFNGKEQVKEKRISKAKMKEIHMKNMTPEAIEQQNIINDFKKILWKKKNLGRLPYEKNMPNEMKKGYYVRAHEELLKKYGASKVEKVKKSIGLDEATLQNFKRREEYIPLGGMKI